MAKKQTDLMDILNNGSSEKSPPAPQDPQQERINHLADQIRYHRHLYYNATPEISDAKYDALEDELRQLAPEHPVLHEIGKDSSELFTKREHIIMMGSQDKVVTPEEFRKWAQRTAHRRYVVQYKLDGISMECQYRNGVFQCAISRGDGKVGDDYTQNVMKMKGFIPLLKDNFTGATRAEILLFRDIFQAKYADKENCRNASSGIVRRKDSEGADDLNIIYYDAISTDESITFKSEIAKLKWLKQAGFPVVPTKILTTPQEVIEFREQVSDQLRDTLNYDIDGLVVKGTEIVVDDMKREHPMKQIAFKFVAEEIETTLKDVEWSISGHIYTPVAIVEPVRLMGTTVQRASLANPNLIAELGIKIGSEVMISKRGDIIPKIERVLSTPPEAQEIPIPTVCETCNTPLVNEGTRLYCPNAECPKRLYHRLQKWIKKLGIKHFSEKLMLSKLFESGKVQHIADLYDLKVSDLTRFEGVKEKSAQKALDNLHSANKLRLEQFIAGFDIENIGERMVRKIVNAGYDTLDKIRTSSVSELSMVEGFAEITAQYLRDGIHDLYPQMQDVLSNQKITIQEGKKDMAGKLDGMTFCFTGKLDTMKRAEAEQLVAEHGGEAKKSVVNNLTYLVTNSTEQTAKFKKAQEQGANIITEQKFLEMINE
jgi:DNA ligase (NAD+)